MRSDTRSRLTVRPAVAADAETVARIYVESWNSSFGELLSRADRTVTPDLVGRTALVHGSSWLGCANRGRDWGTRRGCRILLL